MARRKTKADRVEDASKRQASIDRRNYFSKPGATAAGWRGGRKTVTIDRRKEASRRSCRSRVER